MDLSLEFIGVFVFIPVVLFLFAVLNIKIFAPKYFKRSFGAAWARVFRMTYSFTTFYVYALVFIRLFGLSTEEVVPVFVLTLIVIILASCRSFEELICDNLNEEFAGKDLYFKVDKVSFSKKKGKYIVNGKVQAGGQIFGTFLKSERELSVGQCYKVKLRYFESWAIPEVEML